jgi:hypothetical protein
MASKHQTKIIKHYESLNYYVIKLTVTNKPGIPDLLALKYGETPIFIECKEKNDTLKPLQQYRIDELNKLGFIAFENKSLK